MAKSKIFRGTAHRFFISTSLLPRWTEVYTCGRQYGICTKTNNLSQTPMGFQESPELPHCTSFKHFQEMRRACKHPDEDFKTHARHSTSSYLADLTERAQFQCWIQIPFMRHVQQGAYRDHAYSSDRYIGHRVNPSKKKIQSSNTLTATTRHIQNPFEPDTLLSATNAVTPNITHHSRVLLKQVIVGTHAY